MNVKRVYPMSVLRAVWLAVMLVIFIFPSIALVVGFFLTREVHVFIFVLAVVWGLVFILEFVLELQNCIVFGTGKVYVRSGKTIFFRKIQRAAEADYKDIADIKLVASNKNSKNQSVFGVFVQMPYLVLVGNNGEETRICLYYYGKKQAGRIIDEIKTRAKLCGNHLELPSGDELIRGFKGLDQS